MARLSRLGWAVRALPTGALELKFDQEKPPYAQSLDALRVLTSRRLEVFLGGKVKSLEGIGALGELKSFTSLNLTDAEVVNVSPLRELTNALRERGVPTERFRTVEVGESVSLLRGR